MSTKARPRISGATQACLKWDLANFQAFCAGVQPPEDAPELRAIVLQAAAAVGWPRLAGENFCVGEGEASWRQWAEEEDDIESVVSVLFVLGTAEDMRRNGCDPGPPELWNDYASIRVGRDDGDGEAGFADAMRAARRGPDAVRRLSRRRS